MLASINPLGERGRNQNYFVTVTAYVVASAFAGAALGTGAAALGARIAVPASAAFLAALASAGLLTDFRMLGTRVPGPLRQVNENWLTVYRGWVYGVGFGVQLGVAFATIVTSSATWVAFACAFCSRSPLAGLAIGFTFGLGRALPILIANDVAEPVTLRVRIAALARWRPLVAYLTFVVQALAAIALVVAR
jgi:hypothetical protein